MKDQTNKSGELNSISRIVRSQFERMWSMLRFLLESCPEKEWLGGENVCLVPVRQFYHIIGAAEWCCAEDKFSLTNPFGVKFSKELFSDNLPQTGWPDKTDVLKMIDDVEKRINLRIDGMADPEWLYVAEMPMSFGQTLLEQYIYILRHCQHHIGEVRAEFRKRSLPLAEWC